MERKGPGVRLEDVARQAGVSTATVSRCLNSPERVVEETRRRVLRAVETLGYVPNYAARVMAARRSFTMGAIIPTMENAIFARALQAFQEALHGRGYTLLVASSAYDPATEAEQIRTMVARGVDGLLLIGHDRAPALREWLARQGVPVVVAWTYEEGAALPSVGFDNRAAMAGLTAHVLGLGHKRLAMIAGRRQGNDRARARAQGFEAALATAGLRPEALVEAAYDIEAGAQAFAGLMARDPRPTAVLCGNDVLAAGAVAQARRMGIEVPGEVSVTGFDDIELAQILMPALATVHVPHREMGRMAAEALMAMVEGKGAGRTRELKTELRLRGSLGPPKE